MNLSPAFTKEIEARLSISFAEREERHGGAGGAAFVPKDVFNYIYAITFSPGYRNRFAEFLKRDFAKIPITSKRGLFWKLVEHGERLTSLHLLVQAPSVVARFRGGERALVECVSYEEKLGRVFLNEKDYFEGVSPDVWRFRLGGYQICHKWLKDRVGRQLGKQELVRYQQVVGIIESTLQVMDRIDGDIQTFGGWPLK